MEIIFRKTGITKGEFDVYGVVGVISNSDLKEKHKHIFTFSENIVTSIYSNHSDMTETFNDPYEGLPDTRDMNDIALMNIFNGMTSEGMQIFTRDTPFKSIKMFIGVAFLKKDTHFKENFKYHINESYQLIEVEDLNKTCVGESYSSILTNNTWNLNGVDYHIGSTLTNDITKQVTLYNYLFTKQRVKEELSQKDKDFIKSIQENGYLDGIVTPKTDSGYYEFLEFLYKSGKLNIKGNMSTLEHYNEFDSIEDLDLTSVFELK